MTNQNKLIKAMERLFSDDQPVTFTLSKQQLWCMLAAIQLACRHPKFSGPSRVIVETTARKLSECLTGNDSDLKMLFEMGWQEQFDALPKPTQHTDVGDQPEPRGGHQE